MFRLFVLTTLLTICFSTPLIAKSSAYSKAMAAYQERRLDDAYRYAKQAVREDRSDVNALILLGDLQYLKQDLKGAKKSYEQALKKAPSRGDIQERLKKLEAETKVEKGLKRRDTWPFVVRYDRGKMPVKVGVLQKILREAYKKVGQTMGYFPDHAISVILVPEKSFHQGKQFGYKVSGIYDGKIRLPLRENLAGLDVKQILWHEYAHALVHDMAKGRCPSWLNEGIAESQESRVRKPNLSTVRAAYRQKRLVPWSALWKQSYSGDVGLLYQQSYLVVTYLLDRRGWTAMRKLLNRLGQGYPMEDALKEVYSLEQSKLEHAWKKWLKRKL